MNAYRKLAVTWAGLALAAGMPACGGDDSGPTGPKIVYDAFGQAPVDAAAAPPLPDATVVGEFDAPPSNDATAASTLIPGTGIAVVVSDYRSMSLSLLNPQTMIVEQEKCVHSGSKSPNLSQAFSGDVVLPSQPQPGKRVVLIDRGNGTVTWVDPRLCQVEKQISVATGFFANPHDLVTVGGKLFVTRAESNPRPTADPADFDEGSDVLIVDLATGKPEGRIDLQPYATKAVGTVLPRPDRALLIDGKIYVILDEIGPNYAEDEIGPGRMLVIDPTLRTVVETVDLPGLQDCGGLQYIERDHGLAITCNGNFTKFDGTQIATSGIVWLPLASDAPARKTITATVFGRPVSFSDVLLLGYSNVFTVVPGNFGGKPNDQVFAFDFATGTATPAYEGSSGFVLGNMVALPDGKRALVAHANPAHPRIQVLDVSNPRAVKPDLEINASLLTGLPPRTIAWY